MQTIVTSEPFIFGPLFLLLVIGIGLTLVWVAEGSPLAPFFARWAQVVAPYAGALTVLFSIFIVFVATDIWSHRDRAEAAVARQADALRLLQLVAEGLGEEGQSLGNLVADYRQAQTGPDWREPQGRQAAEALQQRLHEQILFGEAAGADEVVRYTAAEAVGAVRSSHRDLLATATSQTSRQKWVAAFILAVLAQSALVLVHLGRPRGSIAANLLFSTGAAFILWITLVRVDPFIGVNPISLEPIAGIHHGVVNRIDPGKPHEGNAGEKFDESLPMRPRRALEMLLASEVIPGYLGPD